MKNLVALLVFLGLTSSALGATGFGGYSPYGDNHWKYPVASVGALPSSLNGLGDTRIVTSPIGIYTWNGSAWIAGTATGTNTGDVTLAPVDSSPNANAATLAGQVLTLQPANASFPGVVSTGTQTFAGAKTFSTPLAYSSLNLTGSILNADLAGSIAYSKLVLSGAILNSDLAGSIAASKLVGSDVSTVGTITSGTWNAGTVTSSGTVKGTAVTINNAGTTGMTIQPVGGGAGSAEIITFLNNAASGFYNFRIGNNYNTNNIFEFTPSTAVDGSTFSTPILKLNGANNAVNTKNSTLDDGSGNLATNGTVGSFALSGSNKGIYVNGSSNGAEIDLSRSGGGTSFIATDAADNLSLGTNSAHSVKIYTGGSSAGNLALTLDSSQNATISGNLTVNGATGLNLGEGVAVNWNGTNNLIYGSNSSNYVRIRTNGTDRLSVDSNGNSTFTGNVTLSGKAAITSTTASGASTNGTMTVIDTTAASNTVILNTSGTATFGNIAGQTGLFLVTDEGNGSFALLLAFGAGPTLQVVSQGGSTVFGITAGASNINVYTVSNVLTVQNTTGSNKTIKITQIKAG